VERENRNSPETPAALAVGKDYSYDAAHDPSEPAAYWFQDPPEGKTLFIVFYTQACRWARCLGCNLPSQMSAGHVDFQAIMAQVDNVFSRQDVQESRNELRKVIVSNRPYVSGSPAEPASAES